MLNELYIPNSVRDIYYVKFSHIRHLPFVFTMTAAALACSGLNFHGSLMIVVKELSSTSPLAS